jgi:hypothetical protein
MREQYPKESCLNFMLKRMLVSLAFGKWAIKPNQKRLVHSKEAGFKWKKPHLDQRSAIRQAFTARANANYSQEVKEMFERKSGLEFSVYKQLNSAVHIAAAVTAQARISMYPYWSEL